MASIALCVIMKAQPGQREEIKKLWEQHVKQHAEDEETLRLSCYSYVNEEPDSICLFEVSSDPGKLQEDMSSEWLKAYTEALEPLLAAPPQVFTASPVWAKGLELD